MKKEEGEDFFIFVKNTLFLSLTLDVLSFLNKEIWARTITPTKDFQKNLKGYIL
jgi:hypothetical protein